jgi:hypothetical protein
MARRMLSRAMATLTRAPQSTPGAPVTISYRTLFDDPLSLSRDIGASYDHCPQSLRG